VGGEDGVIYPAVAQTADGVASHYNELDIAYRRIWGEHVHHGYWQSGRESPAEAAHALVSLVEQRLELSPGQQVCDIGCGYGATAAYFAQHCGVSVTGLTISSAQEEVGQRRNVPGLTILRRDWLDNGLAGASFDRAYAIESSEHMVDKPRFFAEAWRVLRPGGRFVVCAWLEGEDVSAWSKRHLLEPICTEGRLPSMGSRSDYEALAAGDGFTLERYDDISRNVRRTWSICLRRFAGSMVTDSDIRRLALSSATRNRGFILSLPRLMIALRTGVMRYGVFCRSPPGWHRGRARHPLYRGWALASDPAWQPGSSCLEAVRRAVRRDWASPILSG
jgi:tocopherol O-methyltransferase